jgi:uncharacterized protein
MDMDAMLLDIGRFRSGVEHLERRYEAADLIRKDDLFRIVSPVELVADVRKDGAQVRFAGRVKATLELECSRCLEPYGVPVDAAFDLLFLPAAEIDGEEEREVAEEDLGVSYYKNDVIDLGDVMREQFYLALPMKPLCQPDCRGLCPECGKNRNRESCSCQSEWVDPRLEPLRKLRKNV